MVSDTLIRHPTNIRQNSLIKQNFFDDFTLDWEKNRHTRVCVDVNTDIQVNSVTKVNGSPIPRAILWYRSTVVDRKKDNDRVLCFWDE